MLQVFTVKDKVGNKYILPLNSACKFGLYYQKGTRYFDTVEDVMKVFTRYQSCWKNHDTLHTNCLYLELQDTYNLFNCSLLLCYVNFHIRSFNKIHIRTVPFLSLQASPLPSVIAAQCSHSSGNEKTSVSRLEILVVKGVSKVWVHNYGSYSWTFANDTACMYKPIVNRDYC